MRKENKRLAFLTKSDHCLREMKWAFICVSSVFLSHHFSQCKLVRGSLFPSLQTKQGVRFGKSETKSTNQNKLFEMLRNPNVLISSFPKENNMSITLIDVKSQVLPNASAVTKRTHVMDNVCQTIQYPPCIQPQLPCRDANIWTSSKVEFKGEKHNANPGRYSTINTIKFIITTIDKEQLE